MEVLPDETLAVEDESAEVFDPKKPLCWTHVLDQNIRGMFGKCLQSSFRSETSSRKWCMLENLTPCQFPDLCLEQLTILHYTCRYCIVLFDIRLLTKDSATRPCL